MSDPLTVRAEQRTEAGIACRDLVRGDREWCICWACPRHKGRNVRHPLNPANPTQDYHDFRDRHKEEWGCLVVRVGPDAMRRAVNVAQARKRARREATAGFVGNADVKEAFQSGQTLDLTGIGIATSVTAGWCSNWIDNTSNLYLDVLVWYYSQAVNTAASSQKEHVLFGPGSFATGDLPVNTAGNTVTNSASTSATLTYLDYTANDNGFPIIQRCPYITTNKAICSNRLFGYAKAHDGIMPLVAWLGLINAAGPTIGTGGGTPTAIKFRGVYNTVV